MSTKLPKRLNIELPETIVVSALSEDTQDVLETFGLEAPSKLNAYAIAVEDALLAQVERLQQAQEEIVRLKALLEEHNINYTTEIQ